MTEPLSSGPLKRLVDRVSGRDTARRLRDLERAVRKLAEAQRDQASGFQARLADVTQSLQHVPSRKDVDEVLHAVRAVAAQLDHSVEDRLAHGGPADRQRLDEKRLLKRLDQIASSDQPVLVGPWSGEVGFELLYWVPFVEWVRARFGLGPDRLVTVSRGGVSSWYGVEGSHYADTFSFFTPDAFRAATEQEARKQRRIAVFDRSIIEAVAAARAIDSHQLLHPGLMYRMFMPYWRDDAGFASIERFTRYRLLAAPDDDLPGDLPRDYVAVRFYFSECFPDTAANRAFVKMVVSTLAARTAVVVLNPGLRVDDHTDFAPGLGSRVYGLGDVPPERNLAIQSAVIARARAFVGTYGGYSYLAPFYGVPALAFYSVPSFKLHHLHAAQRVFERLSPATVIPIDVAHAPVVQLALGSSLGSPTGSATVTQP